MKRLFCTFLLPLILLAPDGAGGGGNAAGNKSLEAWIERLNKAAKKDRNALVKDMAKALGIKAGDAYKKLKEAGWDSGAEPQAKPAGGPPLGGSVTPEEEGITDYLVPVSLRHKSPHPHYRRAGLLLTKTAKTFEVTKEQLAVLANDPWVEFVQQ